jgi:hypothetical protein
MHVILVRFYEILIFSTDFQKKKKSVVGIATNYGLEVP